MQRKLFIPETEEEIKDKQKQKIRRQMYAAAKFSKQRFHRDRNQPVPDVVIPKYQQDGRPRHQAIKHQHLKIDLMAELHNMVTLPHQNINLDKPQVEVQWIPLYYFDDITYETILKDDQIQLIGLQQKVTKQLFKKKEKDDNYQKISPNYPTARVLLKINNSYKFVRGSITQFNKQKNKFKFVTPKGHSIYIPRINICFDIQPPFQYVQRLHNAVLQRLYQASYLILSNYINPMPLQHVSQISKSIRDAVDGYVLVGRYKGQENQELWEEVKQAYGRCMNQILLQKYRLEDGVIPTKLVRKKVVQEPPPQYGMLPLQASRGVRQITALNQFEITYEQAKPFTELFKSICFESFWTTEQVINALHEIRDQMNQMLQLDLFMTDKRRQGKDLKEPFRYDYFQSEEGKHIVRTLGVVRRICLSNIKEIIDSHLKGINQGCFKYTDFDKSQYQNGKLCKFFSMVNLMIQDNILFLCQKSFLEFANYIKKFIPEKTIFQSAAKVKNIYADGWIIDSSDPSTYETINAKQPLFETDLMRIIDDSGFSLATSPKNFMNLVLNLFDRVLDELSKIPQVEQKCMLEIFKKENQKFVKTPNKIRKENTEVWDQNLWIKELFNDLKSSLQKAIKPAEDFIKYLEPYLQVLAMKPDQYIKEIQKQDQQNPRDCQSIKQEILQMYNKEENMLASMPKSIYVSFFKIHCDDVFKKMANKYNETAHGLIVLIGKKAKKMTKQLGEKFEQIKGKIKETPKDIEKLTDIKNFMELTPLQLERLQREIEQSNGIYSILDEFKYKLTNDDLKKQNQVMINPKQILLLIESRQNELIKYRNDFEKELKRDQESFKEKIQSLSKTISQFHKYQKKENHKEYAVHVQKINETLFKYIEEAKKYNSRQGLFQKQISDYSKLSQLQKQFDPFSKLWLTTHKWSDYIQNWKYNKFQTIDADLCQRFVDESVKNLNQTNRIFKQKNILEIQKISESVKAQVDQFRPKVPLLVALRRKGMEQRHWQQISQKIGYEVKPDEDFNFNKILELGLLSHLQTCQQIGEKATKQFIIQSNLNDMEEQWKNINFNLLPYKKSSIISGFEDIQNILDEHIQNTQSMQFSPFKKHFEERIINWNNLLKKMSDIMEEWVKLQVNWMYLQPIFQSQDISRQLPTESKKFHKVNALWNDKMNTIHVRHNVKEFCQDDYILDELIQNNKQLDIIQRQLDNFLQKKRYRFARFFFLSNSDLLQIVSQTKQPTAVQPHLKKVFQNIQQVEFDQEGNKTIIAMFSAEKQKIQFVRKVDPKSKNVQDWMGEVEEQMVKSIKHELFKAVEQYPTPARNSWVTLHPGQCVLNGSQVLWTKQVEQAFQKNEIKQYFSKLQKQLNELVELVMMKLSKNQRTTVNSVIVIDVHAKDVVYGLYYNNITDKNQFEWISNLRYYLQNNDCYVKCVQTNFPYGYQYLGNTLRLVITALTDKCYMTLMGALKLNLGGAPAGPAGTGKTQTTKDLAKGLAKQCVVFNCSDSMDYIMVGKLFKGLASAGAWACFDEFNRINIQVLSVIAQQLLVLFGQKAKGSSRVEFEGSDIRLLTTFSVFITMNPGYAGRTQLPDNLKALFRPVAMMVPDYAIIGQIMLYSFGFKKGRQLAKKMVVTFKLSSEQLSSQDHYDYGMRAVKSVINAAGLLKEQDTMMDEDRLLLRALRDVNVPKFLKDDIPLFQNIISDLFPGITKPEIDYGKLLVSIKNICNIETKQTYLEATDVFVGKIIQLYDTIQVRHGLMIVGPTGGGKTSCYTTLAKSLTALQKSGFYKVITHVINPKSIKMGQLYGMFNQTTRQWIDGVLARTVRQSCNDRTANKHWIMFDGPVDALWIESMNTVLDDNKKLCLNSGQILTLTPHMTMMFQVEDLAVASPATVSRCGMVYMQPSALGLRPLVYRWKCFIPSKCKQKKTFYPLLDKLFEGYLYNSIQFMRKSLKEYITTVDNNLLMSLTKLLDCYLNNYVDNQLKKISSQEIDILEINLEYIFVFALIWSIGASCDQNGRIKFDIFIRQTLKKNNSKVDFPKEKSVYDFMFNEKLKIFLPWSELFKNYQIDSKLDYHEIIVPTVDSARNTYILKMLLNNNFHVMLPGPTGTGKSVTAYSLLQTIGENFQYISITLSSQSSANQTQDTIDAKLQKRKKGVYGAPVGKKYIIFVDDLNMPKKEEFGSQPPLQLLRQFLDHKGWYNRKDMIFMRLQDLIMMTALGPPGGGRTQITARLTRHFNQIAFVQLSNSTIIHIFGTTLNYFFRKFPQEIRNLIPEMLRSIINTYNSVKNELLPTPKKSHYTFNLRDMNKVVQGICNVTSSNPKTITSEIIVRLWYHQSMRQFHDRLVEQQDRKIFKQMLKKRFQFFNVTEEQILNLERILFCDFLLGREVDPRIYTQITDLKKFMEIIYDYQEELNQDSKFSSSGKKMLKIVLFLDACEHICRICRILRQPLGNVLLLGVGGSGRQSLSKLATFIANYDIFQVEVIKGYGMKSWREDLKKFLMGSALNNKQTAFIFVDTQIINEQMLQDLNGVLNSGDVTGLYIDKQIEEINQVCKQDCLRSGIQPNKMNMFSKYLQRVKNNVHLTIAMSPLGLVFSTRLRMFPSLVNCCTLDWFTEWPEEALLAVGKGQLLDFAQEMDIVNMLDHVVQQFKTIHKSVQLISIHYKNALRRINYVTPTSYLEQLTVFKTILKEKSNELHFSIHRLKSGLNKLIMANKQMSEMQMKLSLLQPELEKQSNETENLMKIIEIQKKEAEEAQKIVTVEEFEATKQANDAKQLARQAKQQVAEADIMLEESLAAVNKLTQNHLNQLKHSLGNPTRPTQLVLAAVVILCQDIIIKELKGEIVMKKIEGTLKRQQNWVETARRYLLDDPKTLLSILKNYKKEQINQAYIAKVKQRVKIDSEYCYQRAKTASLPIEVMYLWCQAMYKFNQIYLKTQPLRDKKAAVEQLLSEKMAYLEQKKNKLAQVTAKIQNLEIKFRQCQEKKQKLTADIADCQIKLQRAKKLTGGLSDQKQRWTQQIIRLENLRVYIMGNSILSSAMICYSGPFTANYRTELLMKWKQKLNQVNILYEQQTSLVHFLGKPVEIQQWNIAGLPKDDNSIENGLIIFKSRRWPLMIDPQNQANKYIKNMGKQNHAQGIEVLKLTNKDFIKSLEACVQQGKWALVQNVGIELDPSLEPILLQQIVKSANGKTITIGQRTLLYNDSFRFFMTTTIPNPHFTPETFVKVTVLNFAITEKGLQDQMLAQLVALENPQLEQKKKDIVKKNAQDKKELAKIEDSILQSLSGEGGIQELLSDETLINQLQNSKRFASQINQRMKDSKITEEQIDKSREGYRPVAFRASLLFFCIVDLSGIDPMYEYSLQWFVKLFKIAVENAIPAKQLQIRLLNLNNYFTTSLYQNVCRSLFEKHKLLFSFLLTVKILFGNKQIDPLQWRYMLAGPTRDYPVQPNPTSYISENSWIDFYRQFCGMNELQKFAGIYNHFMTKPDEFKVIFDSSNPHQQELPKPWNLQLNHFEKIIVLKALRSDKVLNAIENWISLKLGKQFIIPPVFDLGKCFKDSVITTPLIFVLSSGSDPVNDFIKFANEMDGKKYDSISLGQGQGAKAQKMIRQASQRGGWVLLQNCHLARSWMNDLQKIVEQLNDSLHKDFRLWLTSMPTPDFPISVLQNGVKMTIQPPQGLRSNLLRSYYNITEQQLRSCKKEIDFKKLLFGFCFFHAIIQDRRKFGPIGWNIMYEFNNEDLTVCKKQLKMLLDEYDQIPYKVLNYLGAQINYGGRVTDDKDSRLIKTILKKYINPHILQEYYKFSKSGIYYSPPPFDYIDYINYIQSLPLNPNPQIFGLHDNAEITNAQNQTINLLQSILSIQPRESVGEGVSRQQVIYQLAEFIENKTPKSFNFEEISLKFPTDYNQSMNTVLVQQVLRYNKLLVVMESSLADLKKAIKGLVVMSQQLQQLSNQLFDNQVPKLWADKGFLSLKPLASWIQNLKERIEFLDNWITHGNPAVYWFSGFFFPQAFITGTLQNYARTASIAIDKISFDFIMMDHVTYKDIKQKPIKGCYVYGIFLQGCKWCHKKNILDESVAKQLFSDLPMIHLVPIEVNVFNQNREQPVSGIYRCPLYKVVSRTGTLSTTGHSTNFVMFLQLPSKQQQDIWILAGVAAFLSLRY